MVKQSSKHRLKVNGKRAAVDWPRIIPFIFLHLSCLGVFWVGISWTAVWVCLAAYALRMFAITAFYHRYFSHRSFKTSRMLQAVFAFLGASATQRGPLWWSAHHRHHHAYADTEKDLHSPCQGFWQSHMLWFLNKENYSTKHQRVRDWARFPELRFLDRFDILPPLIFAGLIFLLGIYIETRNPQLAASRWQILIWGFFVSTVLLSHITFCINSLAHKWGSRRYPTADNSRNNWLLALLTLGEGWHNNHHHFPSSVRQGLVWWEVDISYYLLRLLALLGLVWDLKQPQKKLITEFAGE